MIADPFVQLRLLDLQAVDTALAQLAHRKRTLPELVTIADCDTRAAAQRSLLVDAQTALADLTSEQRRLEADVDTVRQRATKDQSRMTAAGVPAKEISGLQHEVASLARRQGVLEDELIEVMEQRETAEAEVARVGAKLAEIDAERAAAVAARDAALVEIDRGIADKTVTRTSAAAAIPAELLALYDKIREASGGIGAARLHQRRCEGCRLELAGSELGAVRNARVDAVLRCENCRRILVRTHESGL